MLRPRSTLQAVRDKDGAKTEAAELASQLGASKGENLRLEAKVSELEVQRSATNNTLEELHKEVDASRSARVSAEGGLEEANERLVGLKGNADRLEAQEQAARGECTAANSRLQTAESQAFSPSGFS